MMKQVPCGQWESPIAAEFIASQTRSFAAPRVCRRTGRAYFTQAQNGRRTIVQIDNDELREVLPAEYSVENRVYEYGAALYDVLADGRIIFSSRDDSVRILDPASGHVSILLQSPLLRYSSFNANDRIPWVLAIEEDHDEALKEAQNHVVAISVSTGEVKRIATGADFYFSPQSTSDGSRIAWLEYNHPDLVFDSCRLHVANWHLDGSISDVRFITGSEKDSVAEPRWCPDNSLLFAQEVSGYRQLFKIPAGSHTPAQIELKGLETAEIGEVMLLEGSRTYLPVTDRFLAVTATSHGICRLLVIDLETNSWREAADGETLSQIRWDAIARLDDSSVLVIGSSGNSPQAVYKINIHQPELNKVIRLSVDDELPTGLISKPELVCLQSKDFPSHTIYGFLYLPTNPRYQLAENAPSPLIINVHGGPTGHVGTGLSFRTLYFTSRGYAVFVLNYTGSTGHGSIYRNRLFGSWGIVDAADAADAATFFLSTGKASRVGITGGSAGGYLTLQALTRYDKIFAGGVCVAGISDLERLDESTHKLESDYTPALVLPQGATDEVKKSIYRERSALYHIDKIESPPLLLHGQEDTIVPIEQARSISDALKERGRDVKLVEFKKEGHMVGKPASVKRYIEEEEEWWRKTLL